MTQPYELRRNPAVVSINTKAGGLVVGDDCNIKYGVQIFRGDIVIEIDFNHRSEDITASSRLRLPPHKARKVAHWLYDTADAVE
jgi:hypothetical protein